MKLLKACLIVVMIAAFLGGCCGGGKKETVIVPAQPGTPTLGKQLEDLDNARKKGAISKEEYEAAKKKLLEQESAAPTAPAPAGPEKK